MSRKAVIGAAAVALALTFVPVTAPADHANDCDQLFMFSGQELPQNPASSGLLNLGGNACTVAGLSPTHVDARFLTPGANKVRVGAISYPQNDDPENKPTSGTIKFDGGAGKDLTWTWDRSNRRWLSQTLDLPAGTKTVTASAKLQPRDYPDSPRRTYKSAYAAAA